MQRLWLEIDPRLRSTVIPQILRGSNVQQFDRHLIGVLASYGEVAFPGVRTIAAVDMGTSEDSVRRGLHRLAGLGWLKIVRRSRKDGGTTTNRYQLRIPDDTHHRLPPPSQSASGPPSQSASGPTLIPESEGRRALSSPEAPAAPPRFDWTNTDRWLEFFRRTCERWTGHRPAAVMGRDRAIAREILRTCPDEAIYRVTEQWILWRRGEGRVVTLPAFRSAAEAAYQKYLMRQGRWGAGPAGRARVSAMEFADMVWKKACELAGSTDSLTWPEGIKGRATRAVTEDLRQRGGVDK